MLKFILNLINLVSLALLLRNLVIVKVIICLYLIRLIPRGTFHPNTFDRGRNNSVANIKQGILTDNEIKGIRRTTIAKMTAQYGTKLIKSKYRKVRNTP